MNPMEVCWNEVADNAKDLADVGVITAPRLPLPAYRQLPGGYAYVCVQRL